MLNTREAFKFGFLLRCADEALSREDTQARVKMASGALEDMEKRAGAGAGAGAIAGGMASGVWGALKLVPSLAWLGAGAAGVSGLAGGYGLGKMTEEESDIGDIKKQELIAAYQQQADRIRRAMRSRAYRNASKPRKPRLVA